MQANRPADGAPSPDEVAELVDQLTRACEAYDASDQGPSFYALARLLSALTAERRANDALVENLRRQQAEHEQAMAEVGSSLRAVERERDNWQALGRSAVEAAQEVIGQCDCIMAETSEKDPRRLWYEARDAFRRAAAARGSVTGEAEFGRCLEWCPMCAHQSTLGDAGPVEGAKNG